MNKKFLSAILFGALMVTSTGTFVSCKDYDDEIDEINSELSEVKSQISALQNAINAGKWITSISQTADGLKIVLSDGTSYEVKNGKDGAAGADGVDGAAGTEWTISEDGFWVCNGEKTDVKAVGMDGKDGAAGEAGKDAQPEVKKENGKWYLWNGTEFEEITVEAPAAANVPYYFTDPNDANYAILVVWDANGENKQEIRLPLNEGLAQIKATNNYYVDLGYIRYSGDPTKWHGPKALPAKGEYLITRNASDFIVQVTPTNYDLAAEEFTLVNSKNEVAPVILGEPTPYNPESPIGVQSRAVSANGLYSISVDLQDLAKETVSNWTKKFQNRGLSLVASEEVRSPYCFRINLKNWANNDIPELTWANGQRWEENETTGMWEPVLNYEYGVNMLEESEFVPTAREYYSEGQYFGSDDVDQYIYDSYLTMDAAYKADSIKAGIVIDGMKVTAQKPVGPITFYVNYVDAKGHIHYKHNAIKVNFYEYEEADVTTSEIEMPAVTHIATADATKQFVLVDLATYFAEYTADETARILWNADAYIYSNGNNVEGDMVGVTYEYEDAYGDTQIGNYYNLISTAFADKDGNVVTDKSKATHLKISFRNNYAADDNNWNGKVNVAFEEDYTMYITIQSDNANRQVLTIPVTIKNPTAAELAAQYSYNASYYADGVFTVLDATTVDLSKWVTVKTGASIDYTGAKVAVAAQAAFLTVDKSEVAITIGQNLGAYGVAYGVTGWKLNYLNRQFAIPTVNVKFVTSKEYSLNLSKVVANVISGTEAEGKATIPYLTDAAAATAKKTMYYNVVKLGNSIAYPGGITVEETSDLIEVTVGDNGDIVVTPTAKKVTVDTTVTVKVAYSDQASGTFTVTVKAFPTAQ